jgi:hypothetical protein
MLLILTSLISNRLTYISNLMVTGMLGIDVRLTASREEFISYSGPKIVYSPQPLGDGLYIQASDLLFQTTFIHHDVECTGFNGVPVLFGMTHPMSALPFDPFAAAFYMVSRFEEYHSHKRDNFGRYPATESIAWKGRFLGIPIVHLWTGMLENLLISHYPGLKVRRPEYRYVPTIDIDHAWCYHGRSFTRTLGGIGRSVMRLKLPEITARLKVLAGLAPDPYDNYDFIESAHESYANFPLYFVLFADYGMNDNNVTVTSRKFTRLLQDLDKHGSVGIHPSLSSGRHLVKFEDEYEGLSAALNRDVSISRQHFLKLSMPKTYRTLMQFGIKDDYSMGYASHPGFRAGIAMPFSFFDIGRDEVSSLIIHPVSLMDVTMKDYLRLSTVESREKIADMIKTIKSVNGEFVSLWHNESLGDTGRWEGWRAVYAEMVKQAST